MLRHVKILNCIISLTKGFKNRPWFINNSVSRFSFEINSMWSAPVPLANEFSYKIPANPNTMCYILLPLSLPTPPNATHTLSKSKRKSNIRLPIKVPRYPFNRANILSSPEKNERHCRLAAATTTDHRHPSSSSTPCQIQQMARARKKIIRRKNCFSFRDRGVGPPGIDTISIYHQTQEITFS